MRLGIYGGSFDPVHYGHLLLAKMCREHCRLNQVWFIPAKVPPHKQGRELSPAKNRIEMLDLAIAGEAAFMVSSLEVDRGGVSYTVDTLTTIHHDNPDAELFFLMGADSLSDLPTWRDPARICELAIPVVVRRAGSPEPILDDLAEFVSAERLEQINKYQVEMPIIELSSTDLRKRAAHGLSLRFQTPRAVEKYIETHELYRS